MADWPSPKVHAYVSGSDPAEPDPSKATWKRVPVGCEVCGGVGYRGRMVLAEMLSLGDAALGRALLARADVGEIEMCARAAGMIDRWQCATAAIDAGLTSPAEVRRVLGFARFSDG